MKSAAIILSGGKGLRIGSGTPKQYLEICGQPLLAYTLQAFESSRVDDVVIVAAEEYLETCRSIASAYGCRKVSAVVSGGQERYNSVLNGLRHLKEHDGIAGDDSSETGDRDSAIVLIHDGARPFIKPEAIDRMITETMESGAVIAAEPCSDTIKIVDEHGNIVSTTERRLTWAAQTPQVFFLDEILEAYERVLAEEPETGAVQPANHPPVTDDAMVFQLAFPDRNVKVCSTGSENFKITKPSDLLRAEMILQQTAGHRQK